jgi:flagella basal body P-ring formation protein FlgA
MISGALIFAAVALACYPIDGDQIHGKDLAAANPAFAALDADAVLGFAPLPGVQRIFHPAGLLRIARANNLTLVPPVAELCFERATSLLTAEQILPVLQTALAPDSATIEIVDFSRVPVPAGEIEFRRSGLSASGFWRGHVSYPQGRSMPIWAKVRITTEQSWIEAAVPIESGKAISSDQLIVRTGPHAPFGLKPVDSLEAVIGRRAGRAIRAGEPVFPAMLIAPHDVERGEKVSVEVSAGHASISFDAIAESSGRVGELVLLRNPQNERFFQARVEAKGKAYVRK